MRKIIPLKSTGYICLILFFTFALTLTLSQFCSAQEADNTLNNLPPPGTIVSFTDQYQPTLVKGITIDPQDALKFEFVINVGDSGLAGDELKRETNKLVKYFLAALTIPEKELWVNLSPYEDDRIITDTLSVTDLGRDMLSQDYLLKQLTASLMYPKNDLGKEFWDRVYAKAREKYGTTDIPLNTFNKVWIVPKSALVYEYEGTAYVIQGDLEVMLEEDYMSLQKNASNVNVNKTSDNQNSALTSEVVRELLLPAIEKEVNEGQTFANLRQIYHTMILARWYKQTLKESLLGQLYVDKNKVAGIDLADPDVKEKIYQQYIQSFAKGAFNLIKQDYDPVNQTTVLRKYFSGGITFVQRLDNLVRQKITVDNRRDTQNNIVQRNYTGIMSPQDKGDLNDRNITAALDKAGRAMTPQKTFRVGFQVAPVKPSSLGQLLPSRSRDKAFFTKRSPRDLALADQHSLTASPTEQLLSAARRRGKTSRELTNAMPTTLMDVALPKKYEISSLEGRRVAYDQTQIPIGKLEAVAPAIPVAVKNNVDRYQVGSPSVNFGNYDAVFSRDDRTLVFNNPQDRFTNTSAGALRQRTQPLRILEVPDRQALTDDVMAEIERPDIRTFSTKTGAVFFDNNISEGSAKAARSEAVRIMSPRISNLDQELSAVYSAPVSRAMLVMPTEPNQKPELLVPVSWNPKQLRPQQISARLTQQHQSTGIDIVPSRQQALQQSRQETQIRNIRVVSTDTGSFIMDRDIPEPLAIQTRSAAVTKLRAQGVKTPEQDFRVATRAPVDNLTFVQQKGELLIPQSWSPSEIPDRINQQPINIVASGQDAFRDTQQRAERISRPLTVRIADGQSMTFDQDSIAEPVARNIFQPSREILQRDHNIPTQELANVTISTAPVQQPVYARNEGKGRLILPDSWNTRSAQPDAVVARLNSSRIDVVDTTPQAFESLRREIDRPSPTLISTDTGSTLFYPNRIQEPVARAVTPVVHTQLRDQGITVADNMVMTTANVSQPTYSRQDNHLYLPERWDLNAMNVDQVADLVSTQRVQIVQNDQEAFRNLTKDFARPATPRVVTTRTGPVTLDYSDFRQIPQMERPEQAEQAVTNILNEMPQSMRAQVRSVQVIRPESRISIPANREGILFTDTGRLLVSPNVVRTPSNIQKNIQVMRSTDFLAPILNTRAATQKYEIAEVAGRFRYLSGLDRTQAQDVLSKITDSPDKAKIASIERLDVSNATASAYLIEDNQRSELVVPSSSINNRSLRSIEPVKVSRAELFGREAMPTITKIESAENPGGIDLNPDMLDLQIKRDGKGVPLPIIQQPLDNINIEGFVPIILDVTPMTNIPKF